jgi:hypothetical protein
MADSGLAILVNDFRIDCSLVMGLIALALSIWAILRKTRA